MRLARSTRVDGRAPRAQPASTSRTAYGPWRVVSVLGAGAMSVVHRVVHRETGAEAALKSVPDADPLLLASLRREVRALSRLEHDGIVRILDALR